MMKTRMILEMAVLICLPLLGFSQGEMRLKLDPSGERYVKLTFTNQLWLRANQSNPGTLVLGEAAPNTFDIGLRRTRMQLFGQVTDRMFFYTQMGMNNFNFLAGNPGNRKLQFFIHDAMGEYNVFKGKNTLKLGGGLTICNGLSRFSQPSIGTIATLDGPVFAQATVDQTDEFARKLSVFARGQLGRLDYRVVLSDPFPITSNGVAQPAIGNDATFAQVGHHHQYQGFFIWNFLEKEPHVTPYMQGTYLGKKKVLNLEAGATFQPRATWNLAGADTAYHDMLLWSAAAFLDMPVSKESTAAVNAYLGYFNLDYGPNYIRNNGIMNPANGVAASGGSFNGAGNAYPMFGTGQVLYAQAAYKLPDSLLGGLGTLMPYVSAQYAQFKKLDDPVLVLDAGINWLMQGHTQKLSLDFQNRPVFTAATNGSLVNSTRKSALILQYQTSF
ncbi:MAG TPA: hypothetical protein VHS96_03705 [Bacteroidia bacterium]|nr:hypothetical protein [Bacteroidia bacterium]